MKMALREERLDNPVLCYSLRVIHKILQIYDVVSVLVTLPGKIIYTFVQGTKLSFVAKYLQPINFIGNCCILLILKSSACTQSVEGGCPTT